MVRSLSKYKNATNSTEHAKAKIIEMLIMIFRIILYNEYAIYLHRDLRRLFQIKKFMSFRSTHQTGDVDGHPITQFYRR